MGYRSDVGFACDPIIKDVVETVAEWDKELKELIDYAEDMSPDDHGRWRFEDVKWYESYPDVQIIENIMVMCDNVDISGLAYDSYGFIRIGEELDETYTMVDIPTNGLFLNPL